MEKGLQIQNVKSKLEKELRIRFMIDVVVADSVEAIERAERDYVKSMGYN